MGRLLFFVFFLGGSVVRMAFWLVMLSFARQLPARQAAFESEREAHGVLAEAHTSFLSDEPSGQGKAGAAWGWPPHGAPPSIPRRQPRCFPSSPLSESARLLGKAGVSGPVGSPSCGALGKRALPPSAYFGSFVSGGSASRSHQWKWRLSSLGLGGKKAGSPAKHEGSKAQPEAPRLDRSSTSTETGVTSHLGPKFNVPRCSPARHDAQGMSATRGSANSQSASEQGGSAKRERALRTRLASSGGQLTKRTEQGARRAQARATCSGSEALVLTADFRQKIQDISCRELSAKAQHS